MIPVDLTHYPVDSTHPISGSPVDLTHPYFGISRVIF